MNIPKLLRACEAGHHWSEATFLYKENEDFDNAVLTMIKHSEVAWQDDLFMSLVIKVRNQELYYQAIDFYEFYKQTKNTRKIDGGHGMRSEGSYNPTQICPLEFFQTLI